MTNNFERTKPKVSIIIPMWFMKNHNGKYGSLETAWIASFCLERIIKVTPKHLYELIIIDNGSEVTGDYMLDIFDGGPTGWAWKNKEDVLTPDWIWEQADILIRNKKNVGFGKAMNQGVAVARGDYIIPLNNDILVWEGWLESMVKSFEDGSEQFKTPLGALMPNLVKRNYQLDCLSDNGKLDMYKVFNLEKDKVVLRNAGIYEEGAEFGSCFMISKELAKKVADIRDGYEFYDEDFKGFFSEDRNLWREIRELGHQTFRTNYTRVAHVGNLSVSKVKSIPEYRTMINENRELLKKRWENK